MFEELIGEEKTGLNRQIMLIIRDEPISPSHILRRLPSSDIKSVQNLSQTYFPKLEEKHLIYKVELEELEGLGFTPVKWSRCTYFYTPLSYQLNKYLRTKTKNRECFYLMSGMYTVRENIDELIDLLSRMEVVYWTEKKKPPRRKEPDKMMWISHNKKGRMKRIREIVKKYPKKYDDFAYRAIEIIDFEIIFTDIERAIKGSRILNLKRKVPTILKKGHKTEHTTLERFGLKFMSIMRYVKQQEREEDIEFYLERPSPY